MSRPTVQDLHESERFRLLESFHIDEMTLFVLRELSLKPSQPGAARKLTWRSVLTFITILLAGSVIGYFIGSLAKGGLTALWQLAAGIGLFIGILVVHEGIHALVFRLLGARDVGFGFSPKGLMVYAYSQRFVMSLRENALVAVMPFLVITTGLLVALAVFPDRWFMVSLLLLLHTFGCMGDFALIRHWYKNRSRPLFTYDDLTEKRTYFFEEKTDSVTQSSRPLGTEATGW